MNYKLNFFQNCKSPEVISTTPIEVLFEEIRTGEQHGERIEYLRKIGKGNAGFNKIKETELPTYAVNTTFNNKRSKSDIATSTGLIYLDLDGQNKIPLENQLIYASYISVSGTGRGILVKVDNLSSSNIKPVYNYLEDQLNLSFDSRCAEITRQTIITHDPNIYINNHSEVIDANKIELNIWYNPPILNPERESIIPPISRTVFQ